MFFQGLAFLILAAVPLGTITCMSLADGHGEANVKLTIAALVCALRACNFVAISLLSDGDGVIA